MKTMPDKMVDMTITSPPYNVCGGKCKKTGTRYKQKYIVEEKNDVEGWYKLLCNSAREMLRVTSRYVIFNIQPNVRTRKFVNRFIGDFSEEIKRTIVWYKPNGCPTSTPHVLSNSHEYIFIMSRHCKVVYINDRFLRDVIVCPVNSSNKYASIHRAVMNKDVADLLVNEFVKDNDIVLDPFNGVGTTGVSVFEHYNSCKYVGIDKEKKYIDATKEELDNVLI